MKKRGMTGFWITITLAATFSGTVISLAYFNPPQSLRGLLATLAIVSVFLLMCNLIIDRLHKSEKERNENEEKENNPMICASTEALNSKDRLQSEFSKLVSAIAWHNAEFGKELHLRVQKEGELKERTLIGPEDMQRAFLQALKEVGEWDYACGACENTPLHRIRRLREKYEAKAP